MLLYHRDVGFPGAPKIPYGTYPGHYSRHAREEARKDRIKKLPHELILTSENVFEVGIQNGVVTKLCARLPHNQYDDLIIVYNPVECVVITVWLVKKMIDHVALDLSKYQKPGHEKVARDPNMKLWRCAVCGRGYAHHLDADSLQEDWCD